VFAGLMSQVRLAHTFACEWARATELDAQPLLTSVPSRPDAVRRHSRSPTSFGMLEVAELSETVRDLAEMIGSKGL
jgi:hypothetical protein